VPQRSRAKVGGGQKQQPWNNKGDSVPKKKKHRKGNS
jgi:hypothetical protein